MGRPGNWLSRAERGMAAEAAPHVQWTQPWGRVCRWCGLHVDVWFRTVISDAVIAVNFTGYFVFDQVRYFLLVYGLASWWTSFLKVLRHFLNFRAAFRGLDEQYQKSHEATFNARWSFLIKYCIAAEYATYGNVESLIKNLKKVS